MNPIAKRAAALAGALMILAGTQVVVVGGAVASAGRAAGDQAVEVVSVRGTQVPINVDRGTYEMRGDLVGTWFILTTKVLHSSPTLFVSAGKERFRGCLDADGDGRCRRSEPSGVMRFGYLYWASFDRQGDLIRGQCVHAVTGGSGEFRGARGVIRMFDRPVAGGEVRTTYRGRLVLGGSAMKAATALKASPLPSSRLAAPAARARQAMRLAC
jgi:hypothetical protein